MNPIRRFILNRRLRRAGFCTRHLIKKTSLSERYRPIGGKFGAMFDDLQRFELDMLCPGRACELCEAERDQDKQDRLNEALDVIGKERGL